MRILVLEDKLTLADALESILSGAIYIVDVFSNAEEGQYALSKNIFEKLVPVIYDNNSEFIY